jgi:hypothetical protein
VGKWNAAAGALIRSAITADGWTAERTAALAEDAPGGYLHFALLVARVAAAVLVEACGSRAQAAAVVNEWVNESVRMRVHKAT